MPSQTTRADDFRERLEALGQLLARHQPPAVDLGHEGSPTESTFIRNLLQGVQEDRLRALSTELGSRIRTPEVDEVDGIVMRLLLEDYRDAVRRARTAARMTSEKLHRCTTDLREARRVAQRELGC
jgi:hypothetical protein